MFGGQGRIMLEGGTTVGSFYGRKAWIVRVCNCVEADEEFGHSVGVRPRLDQRFLDGFESAHTRQCTGVA